ncbi:MAG: HAD family hydrolase [Patescibacteria group bacterium]
MKRVAIFDVDGTVFRSSLLIEVTDELVAEKLLPPSVSRAYEQAHAKWLDREGSYEDYIGALIRAFETKIKGVPRKAFIKIAKQVVARSGKHVYRYTRDLTASLKKKGYYLLAISNSPLDILQPFCAGLGFDKVYGRIYETGRTGKFTGKTAYLDLITDKAKILRRAVEKEGLTLNDSIGVGDTEADIPFLKLVVRPICFNPNKKLLTAAKRNGWKVVVERKDVIYQNIGIQVKKPQLLKTP